MGRPNSFLNRMISHGNQKTEKQLAQDQAEYEARQRAGRGAGYGAGQGSGYGAGQGAGYGAGQGAGQGAGYGAGQGAGYGAGQGAYDSGRTTGEAGGARTTHGTTHEVITNQNRGY